MKKIITKKFFTALALIALSVGAVGVVQSNPEAVEAFDTKALPEDEAVVELDRETIVYKVNKGDTLWSIATDYGVDVELVAAMNAIEVNGTLSAGQLLTLPNEQLILHTVAAGENLWRISRQYGVSIDDLAAENHVEATTFLQTGQTLVITTPVFLLTEEKDNSRSVFAPNAQASRGKLNLRFIWPTEGVISSPFGMRDGRMHRGLDIANEMSEPVYAALRGKVIFAGPKGTYGNAVIIDHGNGYSTLYAHSSKLLVKVGDIVRQGQEIAKIGSTGRSTGPHVHFEVIENGQRQNPLDYLTKKY